MVKRATKEKRRAAEQREYRRRLMARALARETQAPANTETNDRDRKATVEVPVTPMREMVYGAALDAELAQHAESGQ